MDKQKQTCHQKPNFHIMAPKSLQHPSSIAMAKMDSKTLTSTLKVINVMGLSDNQVKSLTALKLAQSFAHAGEKTLLVEANLRHSLYGQYFDLSLNKGLSDSIEEDTLYAVNYQNNLDILTGGTPVVDVASFLVSRDFKAFIKTLKTLYDRIIIDAPTLSEHKDSLIVSDYACGNIIVHSY